MVAQRLKHLPPMRETRVRSLGWEDPLEKEMVTHSSILAQRIPWMEEPDGLQFHMVAKSWTRLSDFTSPHYSNTVWPQHRLDNRSQWPENRTLDYSTLWYLNNFCCHNGKWSEIPSVQAFFALHSQPSLCESCSTSQVLLAHSGPHPPSTMSPDACSDFASSFDPSDHSPPPITPNPVAAPPNPVPQPPPYAPSF